ACAIFGSGHRLLRLALVARVVVDTFRSPVARTHVHAHEGQGDGVTRTRSPEFFGGHQNFRGSATPIRTRRARARTHARVQSVGRTAAVRAYGCVAASARLV